MSAVSHLECSKCFATTGVDRPANLCEECGAPLLVVYDMAEIARTADPDEIATREPTMWRYAEFLPVGDPDAVVSLGEGFTPLIGAGSLGESIGLPELTIKDEGLNPTGTFKARGASCGISRCVELGIEEVALPTAGNAGGAWACYGAAAGVRVHVAMPTDAPAMNRMEVELFGADLQLVDGTIADAGARIAEGIRVHGWFDAGTLREPYRIEGKKTLGFEICEQLGWEMPEAIVYPAGGGVGIIGIHLALQQLREIGWVSGEMPKLIVVQAAWCAPLVRAFDMNFEESVTWENPTTIAAGLRVPKALGDFLVLRAVRETGGTAVAVTDEQIVEAMRAIGRENGIAASPEGAATFAAASVLARRGVLGADERVVLINTGTALKYPDALSARAV